MKYYNKNYHSLFMLQKDPSILKFSKPVLLDDINTLIKPMNSFIESLNFINYLQQCFIKVDISHDPTNNNLVRYNGV